jgi:hypothetical protein
VLNNPELSPFPLSTSQEIVIGREPGCQITLDAGYGGVSRRHAAIQYKPELKGFEVRDLGSANGTYVNGQRVVGSRLLQSGDRIKLGTDGPEFGFEDLSAPPPTVLQPKAQSYPPPPPATVASPPVNYPPPQGSYPPAQGNYSPSPGNYPPPPPINPSPAASPAYSFSPAAASSVPKSGNPALGLGLGLLAAVIVGGGFAYQFYEISRLSSSQQPTTSQAPTVDTEQSSTASNSGQPSSNVQSYADPAGLFQMLLPAGYSVEELDSSSSILFASPDQLFQGIVLAQVINGQVTSADLEQSLKDRLTSNTELDQLEFQGTQVHSDGTVQVDWIARERSTGAVIDAASFLAHNGTVFSELTLFGLNSPFADHVNDAQVILDNFVPSS